MVKSMIAAFAHAGTVRLSRCLASPVFDFTSTPSLEASWRMEERARISDVLDAVAAGSAARQSCGGCSVHTLETYYVGNLTDANVDFICSSFHSLRSGQHCD